MRKTLLVIAAIIIAVLALRWTRVPLPVGLAESELVSDLAEQGFRPPVSYRDTKYATFSTTSIPCELTWTVIWRTDQEGKIITIDGSYSATCP
jgi:hypothetical protein